MPSERPTQRLTDIIDNIDRVRSHVGGLEYDAYLRSPLVQDAVERCFARISEAAVKIGDRLDTRYPHIPRADIRSFGNRLRQAYDEIDSRVLWVTIHSDLQWLRDACEAEIRVMGRE